MSTLLSFVFGHLPMSTNLNEQCCIRHPTRVLRARGVTVNGTTSFGILIAIGFASLILFCVFGNSTYRRMRLLQGRYPINLEIVLPSQVRRTDDHDDDDDFRGCPKLWECYVPEDLETSVQELGVMSGWTLPLVSQTRTSSILRSTD